MVSIKGLTSSFKRYKWIYLLFLPAFIFAFIFNYVPMYGIQIAFWDYRFASGLYGSKFVGLKHFIRMFNEPTFLMVMRNTVIISFLKIVIVFPGGILFALFLNEIAAPKLKKIYQTISYMPHFLSWIVLAGIIREITALEGPVNAIVELAGGTPSLFLTKPVPFIVILIISDFWHAVGWNSIIYLAAITAIPKELYESSDLDGAGRFRKMLSITFPSILPVIFIMFILRLGQVMNAGFDQILNLYNPLVYDIGDIIDTYVYRVGLMDMNFSYSTAIGLFKNAIGLTLVLITNSISRKMEGAL
jgi:putative aldouronate transport system permease protein